MITKNGISVELQDSMGGDFSIASAAWTSSLDYQKKQTRTAEDVKRIVNMLAEYKHSVPFESVVLRFWIKMPIQTDRQFMTHRLQSASGMSGRYRTMPNEFLDVPDDIKLICNKIGEYHKEYDPGRGNLLIDGYKEYCENTNYWYQESLKWLKDEQKAEVITNAEYKRLREFFRGVLPQNNMTERVSVMNLRAFSNFIKLRLAKDAQPEIQTVAELMLQEVVNANIAPIALEALEKQKWSI